MLLWEEGYPHSQCVCVIRVKWVRNEAWQKRRRFCFDLFCIHWLFQNAKLRAYSVTKLSLIKSWFDEGQFGLQGTTQHDWVGQACHVLQNSPLFCHVTQQVTKTPSALFNLWGQNWQGILTSIIKYLSLNEIEEKSYLSTSYESLKNVGN